MAQGNLVIAVNGSSTSLGNFGAVAELSSSGALNANFGSAGVGLFKLGGAIEIRSISALVVSTSGAVTVAGSNGSNGILGRLTGSSGASTRHSVRRASRATSWPKA